ncbi:MAG TPA: hypothetical protein VF215_17050 [Thermoanaerobaculia bacterium]
MSSKARITADFATPSDVASRLRIPPSRVAELRRLLFELHITKPDGSVEVKPMRGTLGRKASSVRLAAKKK